MTSSLTLCLSCKLQISVVVKIYVACSSLPTSIYYTSNYNVMHPCSLALIVTLVFRAPADMCSKGGCTEVTWAPGSSIEASSGSGTYHEATAAGGTAPLA
jgi:hypothetical protein